MGSYFLLGVSRKSLTSPHVCCWLIKGPIHGTNCFSEHFSQSKVGFSHVWGVIVVGKHVFCLIIPLKMILAEAFLLKSFIKDFNIVTQCQHC